MLPIERFVFVLFLLLVIAVPIGAAVLLVLLTELPPIVAVSAVTLAWAVLIHLPGRGDS